MEEKEFEEMRAQIAMLKEKLNHQDIVNDRLIKQSMRDKVSIIKRQQVRQFTMAILASLLIPMLHFTVGLSWPFVVVSVLLMIFCMVATWYINKPILDPAIYTMQVAAAQQLFAKAKQQYHDWLVYWTPTLCIPWISWYCYECSMSEVFSGRVVWAVCIYIWLCCGIGFLWGYSMHRKSVRAMQDIIDQLQA